MLAGQPAGVAAGVSALIETLLRAEEWIPEPGRSISGLDAGLQPLAQPLQGLRQRRLIQ
jgi:hypothetical protein